MKKMILTALMALTAMPIAHAQLTDEMVEISGKKPFTPREDRAYFLFRTSAVVSPVLMRIPTAQELQDYQEAKLQSFNQAEAGLIRDRERAIERKDAAEKAGRKAEIAIPPIPKLDNYNFTYQTVQNAQPVNIKRPLERVGDVKVMLVEALPGSYIFYGMGNGPYFETCLCLGTVSFTGKAGQITDLGTIFADWADRPSHIPELITETGLGESMNGHLQTIAVAIRPSTASTPVPSLLSEKNIVPADYRAAGKFVANWASMINRLAPMSGVLGYDKGNVLDLISGTIASNQY